MLVNAAPTIDAVFATVEGPTQPTAGGGGHTVHASREESIVRFVSKSPNNVADDGATRALVKSMNSAAGRKNT